MIHNDWIIGGIIGLLAALIVEITSRYIMPKIRRRWPRKERSIFIDPDRYAAKMRRRGEWD